MHMRFRARPVSQRFSRDKYGTTIQYPPGELHPPTVPTQVGKYHSGSMRGSVSSRGEGDMVVVRGSQAHERGLEQRYKHVRGKKRPNYLKPREDVEAARKSGGEWGAEIGAGGLDFETYMKQQRGLERDFGKGYNGGNSPLSPENSPQKKKSPIGTPPLLLPRDDATPPKMIKKGETFHQTMTPLDLEAYMKQQRGLERDFGKGYMYSPSPSTSPSRHTSPSRNSPNFSPMVIPGTTGTGTGTSAEDSVKFSDVQWSSMGSGASATGTTGTLDSATYVDAPRGRGAGKHNAAPGQRILRRKGKFEERDQSPAITPASSRSQTISKEEEILESEEKGKGKVGNRGSEDEGTTMEQLELMRVAMWRGKLERVVPPSQDVPKHTDVLQPLSPSPPSSRNSKNSKGKGKTKHNEGRASPIQKLKGYMEHGVEAVDDFFEKKTNSKTGGKLPSPFEYLLYPSYEWKGKGKTDGGGEVRKSKGKGKEKEDDSDEELWGCVGEHNNASGILAVAPVDSANKVLHETESQSRTKESNVDLENLCKICRKRGTNCPDGFCRACEESFLNTKAFEDRESMGNFSDDDGFRPIPPLKDKHHLASTHHMLASTPLDHRKNSNYSPMPPLPPKDTIHISRVENSRPQLINPSPVRQESQKLVYGGMGDSPRSIEIGFQEWQENLLGAEGRKTEQLLKRWSEHYRGEGEGAEENERNRFGVEEEDMRKEQSPRDSTFYDFWAPILKEDGRPDTPKLEDRRPRTGD